jgi:hypothetical protein
MGGDTVLGVSAENSHSESCQIPMPCAVGMRTFTTHLVNDRFKVERIIYEKLATGTATPFLSVLRATRVQNVVSGRACEKSR